MAGRNNIFGLILLFFFSSSAYAQETDVCCISSKTSDDTVVTRATSRSSSDCVAGTSDGEFKICNGVKDPQNLCPEFSSEKLCKTCGFFWAGTTCFVVDPVKKAKNELEKEQKAKEEKNKKKSK